MTCQGFSASMRLNHSLTKISFKMKKIIKFSLIAIAILAFATTLVAIGIHYEFHTPWSINLFAGSFGILFAMFLIVGILGKFGFYLPRHGPPPKNMKFLFLVCGLLTLASCNQTQPKQFCSELSQECELQKDFVVIKILQNNGNGVDAYGTTLRPNEWYLHSTKSGAVLPLEWNGLESSCVTPPELEKVLAGEKSYSVMEKIKQYKVDTLQNFGLRQKGGGGGISQVITKAILLETDGYFDVFNNGKGKYVTFRK